MKIFTHVYQSIVIIDMWLRSHAVGQHVQWHGTAVRLGSRSISADDLSFACTVSKDHVDAIDVIKVGSSYNQERCFIPSTRFKFEKAEVYNAEYYEEKVKSEYEIHRSVFYWWQRLTIGEFMVKNHWCNHARIKKFVKNCWESKATKSPEEKALSPVFEDTTINLCPKIYRVSFWFSCTRWIRLFQTKSCLWF